MFSIFFGKKQTKKNKVARLLMDRSLMYMCSYQNAWDSWMFEHEKQGFSYKEIKEEIIKSKRQMR